MRRTKLKSHTPNVVSRTDRVFNLVLGLMLFGHGVAGVLTSYVDLVGRQVRIAVLEGGAALLMAAAFIVGAAVLFSVAVDHYDKRENEQYYQVFRWCATRLGCCLVVAALITHLYVGFTR